MNIFIFFLPGWNASMVIENSLGSPWTLEDIKWIPCTFHLLHKLKKKKKKKTQISSEKQPHGKQIRLFMRVKKVKSLLWHTVWILTFVSISSSLGC